jgi:hypothetical protein
MNQLQHSALLSSQRKFVWLAEGGTSQVGKAGLGAAQAGVVHSDPVRFS